MAQHVALSALSPHRTLRPPHASKPEPARAKRNDAQSLVCDILLCAKMGRLCVVAMENCDLSSEQLAPALNAFLFLIRKWRKEKLRKRNKIQKIRLIND
jgi:hypothetical protein